MHQKNLPPKDAIKIVKLINGDDIVCCFANEQLGEKSPLLRIVKPFQIKYIPQLTTNGIKDYIALVRWASYTNDVIVTIPKDKIMSITNANPSMASSYDKMAVNYLKLEEPKKDESYERVRLTDSDNKKINEIFDDEDDEYYNDFVKKTLH